MAIVTGEPQIEFLEFEYSDKDVYMRVHIMFLITPSDPYTTIWNGTEVTAVNLTERWDELNIFIDWGDTWYNGGYKRSAGYVSEKIGEKNLYVYAKEIGIPIMMERNMSSPSVSAMVGMGASAGSAERLVEYSIGESYLEYPVESSETSLQTSSKDVPFNFFAVVLVIIALGVRKRKLR